MRKKKNACSELIYFETRLVSFFLVSGVTPPEMAQDNDISNQEAFPLADGTVTDGTMAVGTWQGGAPGTPTAPGGHAVGLAAGTYVPRYIFPPTPKNKKKITVGNNMMI